ncbi:hypothetical protein NP493_269g03073 [Ridgeia piscesae]|uniref:UBX domain-containing protein n=1 Tax=Ridgeia piscesae TaxID=27915 RepID=A0AAD9UCE9_RIDPI|nr:hypothetical protein NP493_269g03073 [Ridgeia piscesae]
MDWLFSHTDDPDIDDPFEAPKGHTLGAPPDEASVAAEGTAERTCEDADPTAQSLKCDDCGKLLKTPEQAEFHATKTGHTNFSESTDEIKPLTEEEKQEQLIKLQEMMKEKRLEKERLEKQEQIERERLRRMKGKEMVAMKAKLEEDEMKKIAMEKKKEKMEERLARQKVKDDIERDKRERAVKFGRASAEALPTVSAAVPPTASPPTAAPPKNYNECKLQIRLPSGSALVQTFSASEQLAAVRLYIEMNRTDGGTGPVGLMTTFPRKVFTEEEMDMPLSELGKSEVSTVSCNLHSQLKSRKSAEVSTIS